MDRTESLQRLKQGQPWDVLVIGGGATGLGTAVDAASRGYRTALVEQGDFAQGTSSRSTKLVHGGVRYLEQFQWSLVFEALRERNRLMRNAPHLAAWQPFLVPCYSTWEQTYFWAGLKFYDALAGRRGHGPTRWLSRRKVAEMLPTLRTARQAVQGSSRELRGGVSYFDGQFDDARLAVVLARTAADHGAAVVNYVRVVSLLHDGNRVCGARVRDEEADDEWNIAAHCVINATGIFTDHVRQLDAPATEPLLTYSQGVHLVLDAAVLRSHMAMVIPRTDDGRVLFAIPWYDRVILGTTDTPLPRPVLEPSALPEEIEFLLRHARQYFAVDLAPSDVRSVFVGIRPLLGGKHRETGKAAPGKRTMLKSRTASLSRSHAILVSDSGLISVTGGKWTTYRRMAEHAVDEAIRVAGLPQRPCLTRDLLLHGAPHPASIRDSLLGTLDPRQVYGSELPAIERLGADNSDYHGLLHEALPYRVSDVVWATRHEMARTVEDVLARRTRALLLDARAARNIAPRVAQLMGDLLNRDADWQRAQTQAFQHLADRYTL